MRAGITMLDRFFGDITPDYAEPSISRHFKDTSTQRKSHTFRAGASQLRVAIPHQKDWHGKDSPVRVGIYGGRKLKKNRTDTLTGLDSAMFVDFC